MLGPITIKIDGKAETFPGSIIVATQEIYNTHGIIIDPICLLAIIAQEGTGSFNTSSTNLAADGQHGKEADFQKDLIKANNLIFGKVLGYILYGEEYSDYLASFDEEDVYQILRELGIDLKKEEGTFNVEQIGQNSGGDKDGTYIVTWIAK